MEQTDERWYEAEVLRIGGKVAFRSGDTRGADTYFEQALKVARVQGARGFELRAAMSLARLWRDHGRGSEALSLLAPICSSLAVRANTPEMDHATALLRELQTDR